MRRLVTFPLVFLWALTGAPLIALVLALTDLVRYWVGFTMVLWKRLG